MKKNRILSGALAAAMSLSLVATAFAAGATPPNTETQIDGSYEEIAIAVTGSTYNDQFRVEDID